MKKSFLLFICLTFILLMQVAVSAASKPSAPTISSGTPGNTTVKITWGSVSGATKYRVDLRRTDEANYRTVTSSCTSKSYTASSLTPGSTYYFRVYAINSAGTSSRSTTFETHTLPNAPTITSLTKDTNGGLSLNLTWNSVSGATKYTIMYRRADKDSYSTLAENVTGTSYTHTGLISGARYYYRVYAVRVGNYGNEGSRTTKNYTSARSDTKGNYVNMSRAANDINNDAPTNVILSWKPLISDEDFSYYIYRKGPYDSDFAYLARTNETTYTDTSATPGVIYKYKVDGALNNPYAWRTSTGVFYAGSKITNNISLTPYSANQMKILWDSPASKTPLTYVVKKWNGSEYENKATITGNTYIDSGLTSGNTYQYYIQVRDSSDHYLTSTYGQSAALQPVNLGNDFYASIVTQTGNLPIRCTNADILLGDNENKADTLWHFVRDSDGSYQLVTGTSGEVMDAYGWGNSNGTNVFYSSAHDDNKTNQRWFIFEQDGGYVFYPSYSTSLVLDVNGANISAGTNIQLWERNNGIAQVFKINKKDAMGNTPVLNVNAGNSDTNTTLSWSDTQGAGYYALSIYKDGSLYKEMNITETEYTEVLPNGNYSATVTAKNAFTSKISNTVTFEIGCVHQYNEWQTQTEPTCESKGTSIRKCIKCGSTESKDIEALGHSYSEYTTPATCTENGKTESICDRCKDIERTTVIPALGHDFEVTSHKEPTCTDEGETVTECKHCGLTNTEKSAPNGHSFGEWTVSKEATCTEDGERVCECSVCGEEKTATINKTEHIYERVKGKPESDTATPPLWYVCKLCGNTIETDDPYLPDPIEQGEIIVGSVEATRGKEISIPISIIQNPGISSFTIKLDYDKDVLIPVADPEKKDPTYIRYGNLLKDKNDKGIGSFDIHNLQGTGDTVITWKNNEIVEGDGELFNIHFLIDENAELKDYPIKITYEERKISKYDTEIRASLTNGNVKANKNKVIRGDIDLNGVPNGEDCTLLARYMVIVNEEKKKSFFSENQLLAANVYADKEGNIDVNDGIRLAQLVAGYIFDDEKTDESNSVELMAFKENTVVTIGNSKAKAGGRVEVPVTVSGNAGFAGFDMKFNYDSRYLKPVDVINGAVVENVDCECEFTGKKHKDETVTESNAEYFRVYAANSNNMSENGELFRIVFEVSEDVPLDSTLPIELDSSKSTLSGVTDGEINDVSATAVSGGIEISDIEPQYIYEINSAEIIQDGSPSKILPENGDFDIKINFTATDATASEARVITAVYDVEGSLIKYRCYDMDENTMLDGECTQHIGNCDKEISEVKIFIWNTLDKMLPLAECYEIR